MTSGCEPGRLLSREDGALEGGHDKTLRGRTSEIKLALREPPVRVVLLPDPVRRIET